MLDWLMSEIRKETELMEPDVFTYSSLFVYFCIGSLSYFGEWLSMPSGLNELLNLCKVILPFNVSSVRGVFPSPVSGPDCFKFVLCDSINGDPKFRNGLLYL